MLRSLTCAVALLVAAAANAQPPASASDGGQDRIRVSFEQFASDWMERARLREASNRNEPDVVTGPAAPVVTYRGYGDEYSLELRPTGHSVAPYVGLLRYTELVYSCTGMEASECSLASTLPVTEIFRYQRGSWSY